MGGQLLEREKTFDAGLIGPGGLIAPEVGRVILVTIQKWRRVLVNVLR